jgi:K+ transporter
MNRVKRVPVIGGLVGWAEAHPRLAAWAVLAIGMVVILLFEARDVGLTFGQWVALVVATVLVAGACIWIVSWEDEDEAVEEADSAETDTGEDKTPEAEEADDDEITSQEPS